ncbi:DUF4868 domain-containing protein [Erwinia persicina]|uniref:DUF4868 domain-containing protein n=1 Tax=Erwinia persicina TaxID=55211 RepID=UPI0016544BE1|nr:DUF4868 domain-containing protein [Erwinia persicina]MBC3945810.1 DUF4868 domain-containing protein [Erwinia persicina]
MPIFAVMDNNTTHRIMRIDTDKKTDTKLIGTFKDQYAYFESHYNEPIKFYAGYKPCYSEHLFLDNFTEADELIDAVKRNTGVPVWDPKTVPVEHIKALFVGIEHPANSDKIAIQGFNKGQILDISKSLWLSGNVFTMASSTGFNIDDKLVAVIEKKTIKFKSLIKLRGIFNMDRYFKEATDTDLTNFCANTVFKTDAGFDMTLIADTVIRTKITLINKSGILGENISKLKGAAKSVNFDLQTDVSTGIEKIVMPNTKREIKALLTFLDEDIFISVVSSTRYKSSSKRPM